MAGINTPGSHKALTHGFVADMEADKIAITWRKLAKSGWLNFGGTRGAKPKHLLMALLFLNNCSVEEVHASHAGCMEPAFANGLGSSRREQQIWMDTSQALVVGIPQLSVAPWLHFLTAALALPSTDPLEESL